VSLAVDAVGRHTAVQVLENLFADAFQAKSLPVEEVIAAAVEVAAAEADVPGPYNAAPIPNLHLANYLRPFQQKPRVSYKEGFPRLMMSATCLARSSVALTLMLLALSSLLLASACPLQP
jgi:hypothetical protein